MDTSKKLRDEIINSHNVDTLEYASLSNKLFKLIIDNDRGPAIYVASITTKLLDDLSKITSYIKIIPTILTTSKKNKYQIILCFDNIHFDKYRLSNNELQLKYKSLKICYSLYEKYYSEKHFISLTKTINEIFINCTFDKLIISSKKCFYSSKKTNVIPKKQCIKHYNTVIKECNIKTIQIDSNLLKFFDYLTKEESKEIKIVYRNNGDEKYINKFNIILMIFNKSSQNTPLNIKTQVEELEIYHPPIQIIPHIISGIKNKITKITLHVDVSNDIPRNDTENVTMFDNVIESYDALFEFVITGDDNNIFKSIVTHLEKYCGKKQLSIISQIVDKKKEEISSSDESSSDESSSDESSSDESSSDESSSDF